MKEKPSAWNIIGKFFPFLLFVALFVTPATAVEFGGEISSEDQETFDQILQPILKIYNLVKYVATAIAVIVLLFAGISYMISGGDPKKRDTAKHMATYVIVGLVVIWAAPLVVNYVIA